MQNYFAFNKKLTALLCAFVLLLGVNVFLQFDVAEEVFNQSFSTQTVASQKIPSEVCGTRAQISSSIPCGASWNILPGLVGSTSQSAKLQFAHTIIAFSAVEVSLQTPSFYFSESFYKNVDLFAHSGLSPPVA